MFRSDVLRDVYRVEMGLGRMVITYSERRQRITKGKPSHTREVGKKLRRLREKERKLDVPRKTSKIIESLAVENKAVVVVGNINGRAKKEMEDRSSRELRHRIH